MIWVRSALYNGFFYLWLSLFLVTAWVLLPFPRTVMQEAIRKWAWTAFAGMRVLGGVRAQFVGVENIPKGPVVIASKHQSTWETFVLYALLENPNYILKKELMNIPFWGWYANKVEHIAVDRSAGAKTLKGMVRQCRDLLSKGRQLIIFPEGTRSAPGEQGVYHPGIAAIYKALPDDVKVVPVALNSGVHWGRRRFKVVPGTITMEFLEPIETGMDRRDFMKLLEDRIETASLRLLSPPSD